MNRKTCFGLILIITVSVLWMTFMYFRYNPFTPQRKIYRFPLLGQIPVSVSILKWIIVPVTDDTSFDDVEYLSTLPDWHVLLVVNGNESHWTLYNNTGNITVLNSKDSYLNQLQLFTLHQTESGRKLIGYLYAILNGADVILIPEDNKIGFHDYILQKHVNILQYQGQSRFKPSCFFGSSFRLKCSHFDNFSLVYTKTPSIQHVLTDSDISGTSLNSGKYNVDSSAPPIAISRVTLAPMKYLNTLVTQEGLWALVFMLSNKTEVVHQLWSYRLLREIGGTVGLFSSNMSHSMTLKNQTVSISSSLSDFFADWSCSHRLTFFECVTSLSLTLTKQGFWNISDSDLVLSWINDLKRIGYREPDRLDVVPQTIGKVRYNPPSLYVHDPESITVARRKQIRTFSTWCFQTTFDFSRLKTPPKILPNILLIIVFNFPFYDNIPYLESMYSVKFPHIIYCGTEISKFDQSSKSQGFRVTFIEIPVYQGYFAYRCITSAMKMHYRVDGYLLIGDDTLLNYWNIDTLPLDNVWYTVKDIPMINRHTGNAWHWWNKENGRTPYNKVWNKLLDISKSDSRWNVTAQNFFRNLQISTGHADHLYHHASDIVYIPKRFTEETIFLMDLFSRYNVFLEIVIPSVVLGFVPRQKVAALTGQYLWYGGERDKVPQLFRKIDHYLHPVKLSQFKTKLNKFFCKQYFPNL